MFDKLNEFRLALADLLNIIIFSNEIILINFWSVLHILFGFIVMWFVFNFFDKTKERFLGLVIIIILWEIYESMFILFGSSMFRAEPSIDILWDLIAGVLGGSFYWYLRRNK
jgi:hypothetical protein